MNKLIKDAIEESWRDYQDTTIREEENEHLAHEHGWKDGYEWILTELTINNEISPEIMKKYMDKIVIF